MQMKILPKHLRIANRYILIRIHSSKPIEYDDFSQSYQQTIKELVGIFGLAKTSMQILKNKYQYPYALIKTNPKSIHICQAACAYLQKIQNQNVRIHTELVSGTIRKITERVKENGHANNKPSNDGV